MILALLPVIVSQDIGDDITHNDAYKHDYTEVVKGLSMVLLHCASPSGKWEQAGIQPSSWRPYASIENTWEHLYNGLNH